MYESLSGGNRRYRYSCLPTAWMIITFIILTAYVVFDSPACENEDGGNGKEQWQLLFGNKQEYSPLDDPSILHSAAGWITMDELELMYSRLNYKIVDASIPLAKLKKNEGTCSQIFFEANIVSSRTPRIPPKNFIADTKEEFSMFGYAHILMKQRNDSFFSEEQAVTDGNLDQDQKSLKFAIEEFPPKDKTGLIISADATWIQQILKDCGVSSTTTVGIKNASNNSEEVVTPKELVANHEKYLGKFDFVISFLSIAASGMGRSEDGFDAEADTRWMSKLRCLLKPNGTIFLSVPRGQDAVIFNTHRVYGRIRLPMLFAGFELLATYRGSEGRKLTLSHKDYDEYTFTYPRTVDTYVLKST